MTEENYEIVDIELPVDVIAEIAIIAHEQDITLNEFINNTLRDYVARLEAEQSQK